MERPLQGCNSRPTGLAVEGQTDFAVTYGFDTFILWAEDEGQLSRFSERPMS